MSPQNFKRGRTRQSVLNYLGMGLVLSLLFVRPAQAVTTALDFNEPSFLVDTNSPYTIGWSFLVNQDFTVEDLGLWDATPSGPLGESHEVGLWTGDGSTLLASVTIQTNSPLVDSFRYEAISAVNLFAGNTYRVGALFTSVTDDWAYQVGNTSPFITTAPELTFLSPGFISGGTLQAPGDGGNAHFGPNFRFSAVPEPSTFVLAGLGLLTLGLVTRCRSSAGPNALRP